MYIDNWNDKSLYRVVLTFSSIFPLFLPEKHVKSCITDVFSVRIHKNLKDNSTDKFLYTVILSFFK